MDIISTDDIRIITTNRDFIKYLRELRENMVELIALDLEAELNRHVYGERLCLLQIYDQTNKVIVDPFKINISLIRDLLEDRKIVKIMFDVGSDASLLKNINNIELTSVLDMKVAVDVLEFEKRNLHSVIEHLLQITLTDKSKYQQHNWTRRPIIPLALEYAINDVLYLFEIKDRALKLLTEKGLYEDYILKTIIQQNKCYKKNQKERYKNFKGYSKFSKEGKLIFKSIYTIRDKYAKELNMPPNNVIPNREIYPLVRDTRHIQEIRFSRRISHSVVESIKNEILSIQ